MPPCLVLHIIGLSFCLGRRGRKGLQMGKQGWRLVLRGKCQTGKGNAGHRHHHAHHLYWRITPAVPVANQLTTKDGRNSKGVASTPYFPTNSLERHCPQLVKSSYYNAGPLFWIFGLYFLLSGFLVLQRWEEVDGEGRNLWKAVTIVHHLCGFSAQTHN